jgi:hypothetical protein
MDDRFSWKAFARYEEKWIPKKISKKTDIEGLIKLKEFSDDPKGLLKKVQIVAIHGLNGDPFESWTAQSWAAGGTYGGNVRNIWFRDFVPNKAAALNVNVEILTFGYNSKIAFSNSVSGLRDYALSLLAHLSTSRQSSGASEVPIVFLCHSFGGIVFKKLLVVAHERQSIYQQLSESIKGVVFLGTPHHGSDKAKWTKYLRSLARIITLDSIRTDLLKNLETNSQELTDLSKQCVERLETLTRIESVYETQKENGLIIVDRDSAVLDISNERPIPIEASHRELPRFSEENDTRYAPLLDSLLDMLKVASEDYGSERKACLNSLYFPEYNHRRCAVATPFQGTFDWIWQHELYSEWETTASSSFLWLQGKPASGKSTLCNHVRSRIDHRMAMNNNIVCITVDFFYSERENRIEQKGHEWMIRSLLYQVLEKTPALWPDFRQEYKGLGPGNEWNLAALQGVLRGLGKNYDGRKDLVIFVIVDALDESEEDRRREIVELLYSLRLSTPESRVRIKTLVASRPMVLLDSIFWSCPMIRLENETSRDIRKFVTAQTEKIALNVMRCHISELALVQEYLIDKSQGVFLWVSLVLQELEDKAMEEGCSIADIEKILREVPSDLQDLYARIDWKLQQMKDKMTIGESQSLFRWILHSSRPLAPDELGEVLASTASLAHVGKITLEHLKRHRLRNVRDRKRRIRSRCGNLVEIVQLGHNGEDGGERVQFIHRTVREYLLAKPTTSEISVDEGQSKAEIQGLCEAYVDFLMECFAGLSEFGEEWSDENLDQFLQSLRRNSPKLLRFLFDQSTVEVELARIECDVDYKERGMAPVLVLYRIICAGFLKAILDTERPYLETFRELKRLLQRPGLPRNMVNVHCAIRSHSKELGRRRMGDDPVQDHFVGLLHLAVLIGYPSTVKECVEDIAWNINKSDHIFGTPLQIAVMTNNEKVVEVLLDQDVNLKFSDSGMGGSYCTAVQAAAAIVDFPVLNHLCKRGALRTEVQGGIHGSALQAAAFTGDPSTVSLILSSSGGLRYIDAKGPIGYPLHIAAYKGHEKVAKKLVQAGANQYVRADYGTYDGRVKYCGRPHEAATTNGHHGLAAWLLQETKTPTKPRQRSQAQDSPIPQSDPIVPAVVKHSPPTSPVQHKAPTKRRTYSVDSTTSLRIFVVIFVFILFLFY